MEKRGKKTLNKISIPYKIRRHLTDSSVRNLLLGIHRNQKISETEIVISPAEINQCIVDSFQQIPQEYIGPEKPFDDCLVKPEYLFLQQLAQLKIINFSKKIENDLYVFFITVVDKDLFDQIIKWNQNFKFILNYNIFSLNTLTGEAYCEDHLHLFKSGTGYYNLFKKFITSSKHFLTYEEIHTIQQKTALIDIDYKVKANEVIKQLKRNLSMKQGKGKLFSTFEKKVTFFFLKTDLPLLPPL